MPDDERMEEAAGQADGAAAAPVRPFWSGTLSFGLVSIPVSLFPAARRAGIALRMIAEDGTPLARCYYCPEENVEVDREHLVRGFELEDGSYVVVDDEELEALDPKKSRDIDLRLFVPVDQIDPMYFERTYVLTSASESTKAYRLLADVMERERRAGIATFVMRENEYVIAIFAEHGVLHAQTLRFADEVRPAAEIEGISGAEADRALVDAFRRAIKKLSGAFDPRELHDPETEALLELVEQKRKRGEGVLQTEGVVPEEPSEVVDLMEVLKRSLQAPAAEQAPEQPPARAAGAAQSPRARSRDPRKPARTGPSARELEQLSREALYERAKRLGIEGRSHMTKAQLARELRKREAG